MYINIFEILGHAICICISLGKYINAILFLVCWTLICRLIGASHPSQCFGIYITFDFTICINVYISDKYVAHIRPRVLPTPRKLLASRDVLGRSIPACIHDKIVDPYDSATDPYMQG
jgi:hypothetical protein